MLRPADGGTRLTLVHERLRDEDARVHHERGWNGCLESLARSLSA